MPKIVSEDGDVQCLQYGIDPWIRSRALNCFYWKTQQWLNRTEVGQSDWALGIPRDLLKFEKETAINYLRRWRARRIINVQSSKNAAWRHPGARGDGAATAIQG